MSKDIGIAQIALILDWEESIVAITMLTNPVTLPTEMSILPVIKTTVNPRASISKYALLLIRLKKTEYFAKLLSLNKMVEATYKITKRETVISNRIPVLLRPLRFPKGEEAGIVVFLLSLIAQTSDGYVLFRYMTE